MAVPTPLHLASGRTQLTARAAVSSSLPWRRLHAATPTGSPSISASQSRNIGIVARKCSIASGSLTIQRQTAVRIRAAAHVSLVEKLADDTLRARRLVGALKMPRVTEDLVDRRFAPEFP